MLFRSVMISDTEVRAYPLGDAAAHLVGYVQSVTAEDLEKHAGEGYTASSVIGRSGAEGLFESTYIYNKNAACNDIGSRIVMAFYV